MLRLLGALLLAAGTGAVGFSAAARLASRTRALRALTGALEQMERELAFSLTPIPRLFCLLAADMPPPVGDFFTRCLAGLEELGEKPLAQIWREALEEQPMGLEGQTLDALEQLGQVLGRYDGEGQRQALALARSRLEGDLERAEEEEKRLGRIYRVLGVAAGAFLVILLL